jgi:hypothetical protein
MEIYLIVSESETTLELYPPFYSVITFSGNTVASVTLLTLTHAWYQTQKILVIDLRNTGKCHLQKYNTFNLTHI